METNEEMHVIKRDGTVQIVQFDKILTRVRRLGKEANLKINYTNLAMKVIDQIYNHIPTTKLDELCAEQCASLASTHPDYNTLAGRIVVSNHHKNTTDKFSEAMKILANTRDVHGVLSPLIDSNFYKVVECYASDFDAMCDYSRDYFIDYFGFKTLERAYLMHSNGKIIERPQHMWLRVAIAIHSTGVDLDAIPLHLIQETYDYMSQKYFTHATPTLFNAGTPHPQLSSCYLLSMESDSIDGIYNTLKDCALISKWAGGIGLHIHNVRASGSHIRGTNGTSNGIVPMLRVFNNTAKYVDQGGGKRNGSFAIYLEPWHADVESFLQMRKNHGDEELKARDLFYALWIPDLFMERVKAGGKWTLMCPNECPGLADVYGDQFVELYSRYEAENRGRKTVNARDLWFQVLDAQMETGTPYILYKDAANKKSNQKNIGTIKSSNLCTEVIEYSDDKETAVCNLASIALPMFVNRDTKTFDYEKLHTATKVVTNNLNKVIDINFYPTEKTQRSNLRHRPIGIGVQGLADVFMMLGITFYSDEAKQINRLIFETIYHAALEKTCEISRELGSRIINIMKKDNITSDNKEAEIAKILYNEYDRAHFQEITDNNLIGTYSTFAGSPASQGILQFDMWGVEPTPNRYDWDGLKQDIKTYGIRNSLLVAPMPTASTSQILGFNECIEPITSNIYSRRTLAGEFILANKYLIEDLMKLDLWNEKIKQNIIANNGSVQQIEMIPQEIRNKYKTVWEMPMRNLIDMSADRGAYICQSQSLNLWLEDPNYNTLTSMHFYSWSKGLKTGIYYLRRRGKHQAQQFTVEPERAQVQEDEHDICEYCSA